MLRAGRCRVTEYSNDLNFTFALGQALLENQSDPADTSNMNKIKGFKILKRGMPADFKAVNSFRSAKFPIAIILAIKIARGRARLTILAEAKNISLAITQGSMPLPMKSSA